MDYYELKLTLSPNTEVGRDVLAAVLGEIGFESFTETDNGISAYISDRFYNPKNLKEVLADFPVEGINIDFTEEFVKGRDWNEEWEKNFFQPIIIGDQCVIHSSFHKNIPSMPYDIVIDPKMAFGTGHHETTSMMVSYLLQTNVKNKSFLDMGCGTAILAILAKMKAAGTVVAIDIDEWAYNNSIENIRLNNVDEIDVRLGGAELLGKEKFNLIFANINRNILLNDIHTYSSCMSFGSELYLSGFYTEDMEVISKECIKHGLQFADNIENNNWVAVRFVKN